MNTSPESPSEKSQEVADNNSEQQQNSQQPDVRMVESVPSHNTNDTASDDMSTPNQVDAVNQDQQSEAIHHNQQINDIGVQNLKKWMLAIGLLVVLCLLWYFANQQMQKLQIAPLTQDDVTITVSDKQEEGVVTIIEQSSQLLNSSTDAVASANMTMIKAYYLNSKSNPKLKDCSRVVPLERQTERKYTSSIINTMRGLLEPLTPEQQRAGWSSAIPAGVLLKSVMIYDGGVAEANFTGNLGRVAGSCAVTAVRAQIEQTLKQFPGVKSVRICIDGNCDQTQILQP